MSRIRHVQSRITALVVIAAFAAGTLFGPSAATGAQAITAFITNTPANPVPVSVVAVTPTVILASGSTSVPANFGTATIINNLDVSAYKTIRLNLQVTQAVCSDQRVTIFLDDFISPESLKFPDCGQPSILFDTPGTRLTVAWTNGDPSNAATASFEVVGRR